MCDRFRKKSEESEPSPEEQVFQFWMDYFVEATKQEVGDIIRFPVSLYPRCCRVLLSCCGCSGVKSETKLEKSVTTKFRLKSNFFIFLPVILEMVLSVRNKIMLLA